MARLEICLLGPLSAVLDGKPITAFESNKVRALLAYLVAEVSQPQRREMLAGLLWPDWPDSAALRNLSSALGDLRKNIGDREIQPPFLLIRRDSLQLNIESDCHVDINEFDSLLAGANRPNFVLDQSILSHLQSAVGLYRGPFLEGFSLADSAAFEEWLAVRREQYQRQVLHALHLLADYHEQKGEYEQVLAYAYRQVAIEPWLEEAHRQLMRLLALSGRRSEALAQYETCRKLLKHELGIEPGTETVTLYEQIREGKLKLWERAEAAGEQPPAPGLSPYKGLQFFDEEDALLFYGRKALTQRLFEQVCEIDALPIMGGEDRPGCFLGVVGASGSGKSSVVRAGLVPVLRSSAQEIDQNRFHYAKYGWRMHVITPTAHPLEALAVSLTRESESVTAATTLIDDMTRDPRSLHLYAQRLSGDGRKRLLLVVDQLEELFTLCSQEAERRTFLDNLIMAAQGPSLVVAVLRADFYAHCARYPSLREAFAARQVYIGPMSAEELRQAIEGPAIDNGWELEPGLVELILRDAGVSEGRLPEPGALPLLEHALLETWQRRTGKRLTLKGYTEAGGVEGAIARTAENVFNRLTSKEQALARRIFLRLTELGEGDGAVPSPDTRRRVALGELIPNSSERLVVESLINELADARLITLTEDTAEVAHEALIREWPALRQWLSEDREGLRMHRRLTKAAAAWNTTGKEPGDLYRGARLAQASEWAAKGEHTVELSSLEQEFLNASEEFMQREAAEREAQRQREMDALKSAAETAERLAEAEKQRAEIEKQRALEQTIAAKRLRKNAIGLVLALTSIIVLLLVSILFARSAEEQKTAALSAQAVSARASLGLESGQSISMALQMLQIQSGPEAYSLLHQALFVTHLRSSVLVSNDDVKCIAISPTGDRLATASADSKLRVWQLDGAAIDPTPILAEDNRVDCDGNTGKMLAFSPDDVHLAVYSNLSIVIIDVNNRKAVQVINPGMGLDEIAYSPDGRWIATTSRIGRVILLDIETGKNVLTFQAHSLDYGRTFIGFSPDGQRLVTADESGEVKIWSLKTEKGMLQAGLLATVMDKKDEKIQSIVFSPDGLRLGVSTEKVIHILDITSINQGYQPHKLVDIPIPVAVNEIFFSNNDDNLITARFGVSSEKNLQNAQPGEIGIWDVLNGRLLHKIIPSEQLLDGAISSDGQTFFSAHADGQVHSWEVSNLGGAEGLEIRSGGVASSFYPSSDGTRMLGVSQVSLIGSKYEFTWWQMNGSQPAPGNSFHFSPWAPSTVFVNKDLTRIFIWTPDGVQDGAMEILDAVNGKIIYWMDLLPPERFYVNNDGSWLIRKDRQHIEVWDLNLEDIIYKRDIDLSSFDLAFDANGNQLVIYSGLRNQNLIQWWDPVTDQIVKIIDTHSPSVDGVVFSADQKFLLSWSDDQTIKIWDNTSNQLLRTLKSPGSIKTMLVSADQRYLAVSLYSAQTVIYSFKDGQELVTLPGFTQAFTPGGKYALNTIPDDPTLYGFLLDNKELVQLACQRLAQITLPINGQPAPGLKICQNTSRP